MLNLQGYFPSLSKKKDSGFSFQTEKANNLVIDHKWLTEKIMLRRSSKRASEKEMPQKSVKKDSNPKQLEPPKLDFKILDSPKVIKNCIKEEGLLYCLTSNKSKTQLFLGGKDIPISSYSLSTLQFTCQTRSGTPNLNFRPQDNLHVLRRGGQTMGARWRDSEVVGL